MATETLAKQTAALAVQWPLLLTFRFLSLCWANLQWLLARWLPVQDRAPRRLSAPRWLSVNEDGSLRGLSSLTTPPEIPASLREDGYSVNFTGCANLSMYHFGAAYALQRAAKGADEKWSVHGGSSGAFVAAPFAMGSDCSKAMLECHRRFSTERCRVGGCVGIYSRHVRGVIRAAARMAREDGIGNPVERCSGRLVVDVTRFAPQPRLARITHFRDEAALVNSILASCYIPVAYEEPIILPGQGFCVDGCALNFLPNARCVVSPYHCHLADVTPAEEYPPAMVFNLLHGDDILRLFEDGYLDTLRWLEAGAPSKIEERAFLTGSTAMSLKALVYKGVHVALSILGIRSPGPRK